jgi:hypothetical protein
MPMSREHQGVLVAGSNSSMGPKRQVSLTTRIAVRAALLGLVALMAAVVQPRNWEESKGITIAAIVLLLIGERIIRYLRYR